MRQVLSVRDLSTVIHRQGRSDMRVVNRVNLELAPGEVIGVVGESGSGKTLAMLSIMGLLPPNAEIVSGSVEFDGVDLVGLSNAKLREYRGKSLSMIFQNPSSSFNPVRSIGSQVAEAIAIHNPDLSRSVVKTRVGELLERVGLPDPYASFEKHPHEFSGGMLQRAMIAMAMANSPKVLIADEPTTALDVTIQAQILELLEELRAETGIALIVVTHDLGLIAEMARRVYVMYASEIVEVGPSSTILKQPEHPYTDALLRAVPRIGEEVDALSNIPGRIPDLDDLPDGCSFHPRCWLMKGRNRCEEEEPGLIRAQRHLSACHFASEVQEERGRELMQSGSVGRASPRSAKYSTVDESNEILLQVTDLRMEFSGRRRFLGHSKPIRAVDGVSLDVQSGEAVGLIGESGSGKTTFARVIARILEPTAGRLKFQGVDITHGGSRELRHVRSSLQMIFQDALSSLNPRMLAHDIVAEPMRLHNDLSKVELVQAVDDLFNIVELPARFGQRYPHEFSGGQQQRIAIARALASDPALLVLDEPLSALDVSVQAGVLNLLDSVQSDRDVAYLFISHDLSVVQHLCSRVAVMYLGKIVEIGDRNAIFSSPAHPYTRALISAVPTPEHAGARRRIVLSGELPSPSDPPSGCRFRTRCWKAEDLCAEVEPVLEPKGDGRLLAACHFPEV